MFLNSLYVLHRDHTVKPHYTQATETAEDLFATPGKRLNQYVQWVESHVDKSISTTLPQYYKNIHYQCKNGIFKVYQLDTSCSSPPQSL